MLVVGCLISVESVLKPESIEVLICIRDWLFGRKVSFRFINIFGLPLTSFVKNLLFYLTLPTTSLIIILTFLCLDTLE